MYKKHLFVIVIFFIASTVFAGGYNSYQFIIGERAAGMGGAYTALADDSSALWHNPAGIAKIKHSHLNLSADAYSYAMNDFEGFNQFELNDGSVTSIDLRMKDMSIAPTTLVYGNKLKKKGAIAFGLVVPISTSLEGEIAGDFEDVSNTVKYISHSANSIKLQIGMIGYGVPLGDKFNFGVSLGLGYGSVNQSKSDSYYVYKNKTVELTHNANYYAKLQMFSAQIAVGLQFHSKRHRLGLNIQTPTFRVYNMIKTDTTFTTSTVVSNFGDNDYTNSSTEDNAFSFAPIFPARIVLGYAFVITNSWTVSIDVEAIFPLNRRKIVAVNIYSTGVINIKFGTEIYLSPKYILRGGLFTDRSPTIDVMDNSDNDAKIDYYGVTLAFAYKQGLRYDGKNNTRPGEMWTSFGLTYKLGLGKFKSVIYNTDLQQTYLEKDTVSHDIGVFIAKSIAY